MTWRQAIWAAARLWLACLVVVGGVIALALLAPVEVVFGIAFALAFVLTATGLKAGG